MFREKSTDEILEMIFGEEVSVKDLLRRELVTTKEICDSFLNLFDEKEEKADSSKKYYTGKIICVETKDSIFQKGKIYEVKDGKITVVRGSRTAEGAFYENIDQINEQLPATFIEVLD